MNPNAPKLTIDGKEIEVTSCEITHTYTEGFEAPFNKINTCVALEFRFDPKEPLFLQFDPDLSDWPYTPLVRICPHRVAEILFSESTI